jgi:hypothetical protein
VYARRGQAEALRGRRRRDARLSGCGRRRLPRTRPLHHAVSLPGGARCKPVPVAQVTVDVLAAHLAADYPAGLEGLISPTTGASRGGGARSQRSSGTLEPSPTYPRRLPSTTCATTSPRYSSPPAARSSGPGSTRPRQRQRDPRHLLAPVAGRRRPHPGRRAIPPRPDTSARVRRDVARSGCTRLCTGPSREPAG